MHLHAPRPASSVLRRLREQYQREQQSAALAGDRAALLKLELEELMDGRQGLAVRPRVHSVKDSTCCK